MRRARGTPVPNEDRNVGLPRGNGDRGVHETPIESRPVRLLGCARGKRLAPERADIEPGPDPAVCLPTASSSHSIARRRISVPPRRHAGLRAVRPRTEGRSVTRCGGAPTARPWKPSWKSWPKNPWASSLGSSRARHRCGDRARIAAAAAGVAPAEPGARHRCARTAANSGLARDKSAATPRPGQPTPRRARRGNSGRAATSWRCGGRIRRGLVVYDGGRT